MKKLDTLKNYCKAYEAALGIRDDLYEAIGADIFIATHDHKWDPIPQEVVDRRKRVLQSLNESEEQCLLSFPCCSDKIRLRRIAFRGVARKVMKSSAQKIVDSSEVCYDAIAEDVIKMQSHYDRAQKNFWDTDTDKSGNNINDIMDFYWEKYFGDKAVAVTFDDVSDTIAKNKQCAVTLAQGILDTRSPNDLRELRHQSEIAIQEMLYSRRAYEIQNQ